MLVSFSSELLLHFKTRGFDSGEVGLWKAFGHVEGAKQNFWLKRNLGFEDRNRVEAIAEGIEAEIAGLCILRLPSLPFRIEMD